MSKNDDDIDSRKENSIEIQTFIFNIHGLFRFYHFEKGAHLHLLPASMNFTRLNI